MKNCQYKFWKCGEVRSGEGLQNNTELAEVK